MEFCKDSSVPPGFADGLNASLDSKLQQICIAVFCPTTRRLAASNDSAKAVISSFEVWYPLSSKAEISSKLETILEKPSGLTALIQQNVPKSLLYNIAIVPRQTVQNKPTNNAIIDLSQPLIPALCAASALLMLTAFALYFCLRYHGAKRAQGLLASKPEPDCKEVISEFAVVMVEDVVLAVAEQPLPSKAKADFAVVIVEHVEAPTAEPSLPLKDESEESATATAFEEVATPEFENAICLEETTTENIVDELGEPLDADVLCRDPEKQMKKSRISKKVGKKDSRRSVKISCRPARQSVDLVLSTKQENIQPKADRKKPRIRTQPITAVEKSAASSEVNMKQAVRKIVEAKEKKAFGEVKPLTSEDIASKAMEEVLKAAQMRKQKLEARTMASNTESKQVQHSPKEEKARKPELDAKFVDKGTNEAQFKEEKARDARAAEILKVMSQQKLKDEDTGSKMKLANVVTQMNRQKEVADAKAYMESVKGTSSSSSSGKASDKAQASAHQSKLREASDDHYVKAYAQMQSAKSDAGAPKTKAQQKPDSRVNEEDKVSRAEAKALELLEARGRRKQ